MQFNCAICKLQDYLQTCEKSGQPLFNANNECFSDPQVGSSPLHGFNHIFWALPLTGGWNPCRNRFCQLFSWYVPLPITLGRTVWTMPNLKKISQHMWPNFPRVTVPVKLALALVSIVGRRRVTAVGSGFCHLSQWRVCWCVDTVHSILTVPRESECSMITPGHITADTQSRDACQQLCTNGRLNLVN